MRLSEQLRPDKFLTLKRSLMLLGVLTAVLAGLLAREFVRTYSHHFETVSLRSAGLPANRTARFTARALEYARISDTLALIANGMTPSQAESLTASLTPLGIPRLDSTQLVERAKLLLVMFQQDSAACDVKDSGAPGDPALGTGLEGLDSANLEKLTRLNAEAAGAQLRKAPAPAMPTAKDEQQLGNDLLEVLGDSAFGKWSKIVGDQKNSSAAEKCWAERAMYRAVMSMPVSEQSRDLRTISALEAETQP